MLCRDIGWIDFLTQRLRVFLRRTIWMTSLSFAGCWLLQVRPLREDRLEAWEPEEVRRPPLRQEGLAREAGKKTCSVETLGGSIFSHNS
jgi:hypothetical protein